MTNERIKGEVPDWQRQAWLTEYQTCQQTNSAQGISYWTMASMFIAFSSVLLGALIYAFIANGESQLFGIIACIISIAIMHIFYFLYRWIKRLTFLQKMNFIRMREIEIITGMRSSLRILGMDSLDDLNKELNIFQIKQEDKDTIKSEIKNFKKKWRNYIEYELSGTLYFKGIIFTLLILWTIIFIGGITLLFYNGYATTAYLTTVILLLIILSTILIGAHYPKNHPDSKPLPKKK